ncbi:hypothetical protein EVAR_26978_1 [Eumeta japonica]|uniref:Uncharacterized protein n=1 Tax=Eumeta variegata TaxID=151549 RepID=A0A4C1VLA9_EUMVA|nr:hypothetical protein EVAR_26978_1 [Eumeta japonica]
MDRPISARARLGGGRAVFGVTRSLRALVPGSGPIGSVRALRGRRAVARSVCPRLSFALSAAWEFYIKCRSQIPTPLNTARVSGRARCERFTSVFRYAGPIPSPHHHPPHFTSILRLEHQPPIAPVTHASTSAQLSMYACKNPKVSGEDLRGAEAPLYPETWRHVRSYFSRRSPALCSRTVPNYLFWNYILNSPVYLVSYTIHLNNLFAKKGVVNILNSSRAVPPCA